MGELDRARLAALVAALRTGEIGRADALAGLRSLGMTEAQAEAAIVEAAAPPCPASG